MKLVKIGDIYINLENITHVEFETSTHGLKCTVYFNCQTTDSNGCNGVQASTTLTADAARDLKAWLDLRLKVLETEKFPEILYEASAISVAKMADMLYSVTLNGNLTMHGVTRSQPIVTRVALLGSMLRASGDFSLNQTDYNIKLVSVAGGALKLKDELSFSFEIVARKQD